MDKYRNKYRIGSIRMQNWDYGWPAPYFITICTKNRVKYFGEIINRKMHHSQAGIIAEQLWHETANHTRNIELGPFVVMPNHIHGILILKPDGNGTINRAKNENIRDVGMDIRGVDIRGVDNGGVDNGAADNGAADNGAADDGAADNGAADNGGADNGAADDGAADNGAADNGAADDGAADDGAADNGAADDVETRHALSLQQQQQQQQQQQRSPQPSPPAPHQNPTPGQKRFQNQGKNTVSSIIGGYKSAVSRHAHRLGFEFQWQERFYEHIIRDNAEFERVRNYIFNNPANWHEDDFFNTFNARI